MKADPRRQEVLLARIKSLEDAIAKAQEYLQTGAHADWKAFRPYFVTKMKDGKELPPHPDGVKNVFIRDCERKLKRVERLLDRMQLEIQKASPDENWPAPLTLAELFRARQLRAWSMAAMWSG